MCGTSGLERVGGGRGRGGSGVPYSCSRDCGCDLLVVEETMSESWAVFCSELVLAGYMRPLPGAACIVVLLE